VRTSITYDGSALDENDRTEGRTGSNTPGDGYLRAGGWHVRPFRGTRSRRGRQGRHPRRRCQGHRRPGVGSIVGTLLGLYTHGDDPYQITYGVAEDMVGIRGQRGFRTAGRRADGRVPVRRGGPPAVVRTPARGRWRGRAPRRAHDRRDVRGPARPVDGRGDAVRPRSHRGGRLRRRLRRRESRLGSRACNSGSLRRKFTAR